jgi:ankyrin repeat protein
MKLKPIVYLVFVLCIAIIVPLKGAEIHKAAKDDDLATIQKLLEKNPKLLNSVNALNQTPLLIASYMKNNKVVKFLLDKGADLEIKDRYGSTALHMAVVGDNKEGVEMLVQKGANINATARNGKIPLQLAFEGEYLEIIDIFLKMGMKINAPIDQNSRTLLHRAAIMGKAKVAQFLIDKGADMELKDKAGRTALDYALIREHSGVVQVLKAKGAKFEPVPELEITYVANEGFVIAAGLQKVMIDTLFRVGYAQYQTPTQDILDKMGRNETPFNGVKFLLVTHNHPDHFDIPMVETFLMKNTNVLFLAPRQVLQDIEIDGAAYQSLKHRSVALAPPMNSHTVLTIKDLSVCAMRLNHADPEMQNLGYILLLKGRKVAHLGDAAIKDNRDNFIRTGMAQMGIDVLFIQYKDFFVPESSDFIEKSIRPKHIILMHIPPNEIAAVETELTKYKDRFPSVTIFKTPLEKKTFK